MMKNNRSVQQFLKSIALIFILAQLFGCATNEKTVITPAATDNAPGNRKVVNEALQLQGHPYVPGGESPAEGFDCSGLVYYVYNKHGLKLPRDTWSLANQLPSVQLDQRQPGDLVFFTINARPHSHVGIYVGEDKFVHAPSSHTGRVMMSDLKQPYWRERFSAVRRPHKLPKPVSLNETSEALCLLD
jgi:cell wall-associated NlpC family hydrolase